MTGKDMPMRLRKLKIALAQCCDVLDSREVVAQDDHGKYSACFEKGHVPLCFFRKEVPVDVAFEYFTYWCRSFSAIEDHMLCALDELCTSSKEIYSSDDCQRLCIATVRCLSEQSLKAGLFFKAHLNAFNAMLTQLVRSFWFFLEVIG